MIFNKNRKYINVNRKLKYENNYRMLSVRERGDEYSFDSPFRCLR